MPLESFYVLVTVPTTAMLDVLLASDKVGKDESAEHLLGSRRDVKLDEFSGN